MATVERDGPPPPAPEDASGRRWLFRRPPGPLDWLADVLDRGLTRQLAGLRRRVRGRRIEIRTKLSDGAPVANIE